MAANERPSLKDLFDGIEGLKGLWPDAAKYQSDLVSAAKRDDKEALETYYDLIKIPKNCQILVKGRLRAIVDYDSQESGDVKQRLIDNDSMEQANSDDAGEWVEDVVKLAQYKKAFVDTFGNSLAKIESIPPDIFAKGIVRMMGGDDKVDYAALGEFTAAHKKLYESASGAIERNISNNTNDKPIVSGFGGNGGKGGGGRLSTIADIETHLAPLFTGAASSTFDITFREYRQNNGISSRLCSHRMPIETFLDKTRKDALGELDKFLHKDHFTGQERENNMFGIESGSGNGKSHFADYIVNVASKDKHFSNFEFIPFTFNDAMKWGAQDFADVEKHRLLDTIGRRIIYSYLFDVSFKADSNESNNGAEKPKKEDEKDEKKMEKPKLRVKTSRYSDKYKTFCNFCSVFDIDFVTIIDEINGEIEANGKELVLICDDVHGGTLGDSIPINAKGDTLQVALVKRIAAFGYKAVFCSTVDISDQIKASSWHTISGVDLRDPVSNDLAKHDIILGESGKYLLKLFGVHSRSYGCFYFAIMHDTIFRQVCCDKDELSIEKAIKIYHGHFVSGRFGPTDTISGIMKGSKKNETSFLIFICMFVLGIKRGSGVAVNESKLQEFKEHGLLREVASGIDISPMLIYVWSQSEIAAKGFEVGREASENISKCLGDIFDTISGKWDGHSVEKLIGLLLLLRLNCIKHLLDCQVIGKDSPFLTLGKFIKYGKHSRRTLQGSQDTEEKQDCEWNEGTRIGFNAINWKDIKQVRGARQGKTEKELCGRMDEMIEQDLVDKIKHNNCAVVGFAWDNPSFDILLKLPIKIENGKNFVLYLFCQVKSRGQLEAELKANGELEAADEMFDKIGGMYLEKPKSAAVALKSQHKTFSETMGKQTHFKDNYEYFLLADFPLTRELVDGVNCVENAVLTFAGNTFGSFLKDYVLNRDLLYQKASK